uniref:IMD domain-containing protein n=1 Tax=Kwoniella bestiolae CBS 10118 TaxID=1296100 RepID=A0A1B9FRR1_9TREE|nr:hypothetical protein I302_09138 [Kwoniella bestiolae CBS 10118]OCF21459.1 hypothetical protein I302_09138 [Kwoniella bestiolae CBS 10118]
MFTLKSLSPSRTSLSIPPPGGRSNPTSPSSSTGGKSPTSESGYFPAIPTPKGRITKSRPISREEAFKTVKNLEEVLNAWNEYRLAIANLGRAGRKLAGTLKDLAGGGGGNDKVDVASQTIRPTANMLDNLSDLTIKLSRKIDEEYDEVNSDASKYFNLLAVRRQKESRTHEAYLGAIGKKHDKAEKAYRKASKSLSETSNAHAGLIALKETLSEDINRANEDHHALIGSKRSTILLKIASSTGCLAEYVLAYSSDGLRKSGQSFPDIEYYIKWQSSLPPSLEHEQAEERYREEVRGIKAKVALGELDMIGKSLWEGIGNPPRPGGMGGNSGSVTPKDPMSSPSIPTVKGLDAVDPQQGKAKEGSINTDPANPAKDTFIQSSTTQMTEPAKSPPSTVRSQDNTSLVDTVLSPSVPQHSSPPIPHHTRPSLSSHPSSTTSHSSIPSTSTTSSTSTSTRPEAPTGRRPVPSGLLATSKEPESPQGPRERTREIERPILRYEDVGVGPKLKPSMDNSIDVYRARPPVQSHTSRRSVSNIVNDLQSRHPPEGYYKHSLPLPLGQRQASYCSDPRERSFQHHQAHSDFVRGCELCEMDYERMIKTQPPIDLPSPPPPPKNVRRVTMPPLFTSSSTSGNAQHKSYEYEDYYRNTNFDQPHAHPQHMDRTTSYEYDELFLPHHGQQDGRRDEMVAPKPRRPIVFGEDFERP